MTGWRPASIVAEGLRNAAAARARALLLMVVSALLLAAATIADIDEIAKVQAEEAEAWRSGSHLVLVVADGAIDPARCARLQHQPEVLAAGAMRRGPETIMPRMGTARVGLVEVTAGAIDALAILQDRDLTQRTSGPQVLVAQPVADAFGLTAGESVVLGQTRASVRHVVDASLLTNQFGTALLSQVPTTGTADACILLAAPNHRVDVRDKLAATVALTDGWRASDVSASTELFSELDRQLRTRTTRFLPAAAATAVVLLWAAVLLARRSEAGLYRSLGLTTTRITAMRLVELTATLAGAILLATALVLAWTTATDTSTTTTLTTLLRAVGQFVGITASAGVIATLLVSSGSGIELVKDT